MWSKGAGMSAGRVRAWQSAEHVDRHEAGVIFGRLCLQELVVAEVAVAEVELDLLEHLGAHVSFCSHSQLLWTGGVAS